jgi:hypothetical protein
MADEPHPEVKVDAKGKSTVQVDRVDRQTPAPFGVGKVVADQIKRGKTTVGLPFWLVALTIKQSLDDAVTEIRGAGAIITSSGGLRDLGAKANGSRSTTSFHYTGRAIDLYMYSGMNDPNTDPYIIKSDPDLGTWRVLARTSDATVPDSTHVAIKKKFAKSDKFPEPVTVFEVETTGKFIDLTALMLKHGFKRIPARDDFMLDPKAREYTAAEWWHFQQENGLVPGTTTFGSLLRQVHTEAELKGTGPGNLSHTVWNGRIFT